MRMRAVSLSMALIACITLAGCHSSPQAAAAKSADATVALPFVGCAGDGQLGPTPPPGPPAAIPEYPAAVAARLAYYVSDELTVVAPRGWHCLATVGSSGATLIVTPEPVLFKDLIGTKKRFSDQIVLASFVFSGTSGRFIVADVAARVFPVARKFVDMVIDGWPEEKSHIEFAPYPDDRIKHISETHIQYETPAGKKGLGAGDGWIAPATQPVRGAALLDDELDFRMIQVRLSPADDDLTRTVVSAFEDTALDYPVRRSHQR